MVPFWIRLITISKIETRRFLCVFFVCLLIKFKHAEFEKKNGTDQMRFCPCQRALKFYRRKNSIRTWNEFDNIFYSCLQMKLACLAMIHSYVKIRGVHIEHWRFDHNYELILLSLGPVLFLADAHNCTQT